MPPLTTSERRRAPWLVLWLGFGGLLVCILAAATGTLLSLDHVSQEEGRIRHTFSRAWAPWTRSARRSIFPALTCAIFCSPRIPAERAGAGRPAGDPGARDARRAGCLLAVAGSRRTRAVSALAIGDRRLLAGARPHRGLDARGAQPLRDLLLLRRTGAAPHHHAADRGPHRRRERTRRWTRRGADLAAVRRRLRRSLLVDVRHHPGRRPGAGPADHRPHLAAGARAGTAAGGEHARARRPAGAFRRACCARRNTSGARWRANCTTRWGSRSPPS